MIRKLLLSGVSAAAIICANTAGAATFSFGFTGQVESGAIETSGTYELRLRGADGGGATGGFSFSGARGGFGALLLGEIDLLAGDLFRVLVGGDGQSSLGAGGGGGLSYFSSGSNLAIAGGGGGASGGSKVGAYQGRDAVIIQDRPGNGGNDYSYGHYTFYSPGGGAGWEGNGSGDAGGESGPGWAGGSSYYGAGGFGGGGGTGDVYGVGLGGGGAGAYGGSPGSSFTFYVPPSYGEPGYGETRGDIYYGYTTSGRGGSSYFSSAFLNTSSVVGQARVGGAYLTLDLLSQPAPAPVPLPASAVLLGSTIAGMGFVARRRKKKS